MSKKTTLNETEFKELVKSSCEHTQWSDYCRNHFLYDEWISMSSSDRKAHFEEYIDESDLEELLEQDYWEGVFASLPQIINDTVCGLLEE